MSKILAPRLIPAVLGLVLTLQGISQGACLHGWGHCVYCSRTTTTNAAPMVLVPASGVATHAMVAQHPGAGLSTSNTLPPGYVGPVAPTFFAPTQASFAPTQAGFAPTQAGYTPAYSYYAPAAPSYGSGFAPVAPQVSAHAQTASYLTGYNPNGQFIPSYPGAPLVGPQALGSHILHTLRGLAPSLGHDKGALLQNALSIFNSLIGFAPGGADIQVLVGIVEKIIQERNAQNQDDQASEPPAAAHKKKNKDTKDTDDSSSVIVIKVPRGIKVVVDQGDGTAPASGTGTSAPESEGRVNVPGTSGPPARDR